MNVESNRPAYLAKIKDDELLCPICRFSGLNRIGDALFCSNIDCVHYDKPFFSINNKPVLIDFERSLVTSNGLLQSVGSSVVVRTESGFKKWVRGIFRGKSEITKANLNELISCLKTKDNPKILIIGGGEIGAGLDTFYEKFKTNILSFDIYDSSFVDIIADGHQIPIIDNYFDAVIIQAVLEHVLSPQKVVSEITRVLALGGIVYAETPFIQQVHEGPYDFTRFTESGHRYLFRDYTVITSGYTSGAGSSLIWSLDFFFSGLFRSRVAGKIARIFFFWLRTFDKLIPYSFNLDAACGVYFMGTKSKVPILNKQIISHYGGHQQSG